MVLFKLILYSSLLFLSFITLFTRVKPEQIVKGPFFIADWEIPKFEELMDSGISDVLVYDTKLKATLFSARAWRYVYVWYFLNQHKSEINSYFINPPMSEISDWFRNGKCLVGKSYETNRDNECYEDLDKQVRNQWIEPQKLKTTPPGMRPFMSTCSIYYSCDIHSVEFPVYMSPIDFRPYISGPNGETIEISGNGDFKKTPMKDSFLVYKSVKPVIQPKRISTSCVYQKDPKKDPMFCNYDLESGQVAIKFNKGEDRAVFNNYIFFRPLMDQSRKKRRVERNEADPATKGDLLEMENKVLLLSKGVSYLNHEILEEVANLKHIIRELILSTSKIDDNMIGKIMKVPMKTTWLTDEIFVLKGDIESMLHHEKTKRTTNCIGTYQYINGRWKVPTVGDSSCSYWNKTTQLEIMQNRILNPLDIRDAPAFRNSSSEYSGWTFLDDGRVSLDWLDKGLKYHDKEAGWTLDLKGLGVSNIFQLIIYIVAFILFLFIMSIMVKICRA